MKKIIFYLTLTTIFACITYFGFTQVQKKQSTDSFPKYTIYSATAYFSGNGSPYVTQQTFYSSDLQTMYRLIDSASKGAIVTLDNLRYIDPNSGTHTITKVDYNFNKGKNFIPYKSPGQLEFEKLRNLSFTSGIVYFTGVGFPTIMAIDAKDSNFLQKCFGKSTAGTTITFDNCISKNINGNSSIVNKSIKL